MAAVLALALLAACQRQPASPSVERIAVLRFENLGADSSADWMGRAFSEVIAAELEGAPGVAVISSVRLHSFDGGFAGAPAAAPGISAERSLALAAGASRLAYGQYAVRGGSLRASLTVEDARTGKIVSEVSATAPAAGLVAAASALARRISSRVTPYATANAQVVRAHVKALEGPVLADSADDLRQAIAADPNFTPVYRQLAQIKAQQNDLPGALALLDQALARASAGGTEHARILLQAAILRNDPAARQQALAALAKAEPTDPQTWRDLAASAVTGHQYQQAAEAFRKSVELDPGNADSWNQLGYAAAYCGDMAGATSALLQYQKLLPESPNPLDSLGDANLIGGRLAEAENYYSQAAKKNPAFFGGLDFLKAAMAHLMTGDIPGADGLAQRYFDALAAAKDPLADYRKAQWSWIAGRRQAARQDMEKVAHNAENGPVRDVAAYAYAELAAWNLMQGNRDAAAQEGLKAATLASPSTATQATLVRFLAQPPAPAAEWRTRADRLAPNPAQAPIHNLALAVALLLAKEYPEAAALLRQMYSSGSPGADEGLPILLAWADLETGRVPDAAALLRYNPPLSDNGLSWSTALYFPRIFSLRAAAARKLGQADEAGRNLRLFQQLSGADPQ